MCCEGLICASCSGPVIEGRCAVYRAARDQLHHSSGVSPQAVLALLAVLAILLMVVVNHL